MCFILLQMEVDEALQSSIKYQILTFPWDPDCV